MANLTTIAVIRAHDQLTGPLQAMASKVRGIQGQFSKAGSAARSMGNSSLAGAGLAAVGLGQMYHQAKQFEEKIFGVGVASIPDAMEAGTDSIKTAVAEMGKAREAAHRLSKEFGMSPVEAAGIQEAVKKAGILNEYVESYSNTIGLIKLTDPSASTEKVSEFGAALLMIYEGDMKLKKLNPGEYFKKAADAAAIAAAQTSLSTATFLEGQSQFDAPFAANGMTPQQNSAMLAAAKKSSGQNHIILGQTYKSMALRMMVPTGKNVEAFGRLGLNRADYIEGGSGTQSASGVTQALASSTQQKLRGKDRAFFLDQIDKEFNRTTPKSDEDIQAWHASMTDKLGEVMGLDMKQDANRERVTRMWHSALTGGGKINFEKLFADVAGKMEQDPSAVAQAFEQRRITSIQGALLGHKKGADGKSEYDRQLATIMQSNGQFLDDAKTLHDESPIGKMRKMEAAIQRFSASIFSSAAATTVLETMSDAIQGLDKVSKNFVNMGVMAGMIGLLVGPARAAGAGLMFLGAGGLAALRGIGWMAAAPLIAAATGLRSIALGLGTIGMAGMGAGLSGLAGIATVLGRIALFALPLAAVAGVIALTTADWSGISEQLGKSKEWDALQDAWSDLGDSTDELLGKFMGLFGMDPNQGMLLQGVKNLSAFFTLLVKDVQTVVNWMDSLTAKVDPSVPQSPIGVSPQTGVPAFGSEGWGPMPQLDVKPGSEVEIKPGSEVGIKNEDGLASKIGSAVRAALEGLKLNVNVGGSNGSDAKAPGNATTNGQSYGLGHR